VIVVDGGQYTVNGDEYSLSGAGVDVARAPVALSVYPNPFSGETTARFAFPGAGGVAIKVFDVEGRLVNAYVAAGSGAGTFTWNGAGFGGRETPPGVYFVRVSGPSESLTRKVVKR